MTMNVAQVVKAVEEFPIDTVLRISATYSEHEHRSTIAIRRDLHRAAEPGYPAQDYTLWLPSWSPGSHTVEEIIGHMSLSGRFPVEIEVLQVRSRMTVARTLS